tara:strand:+ start:549 stop:1145 length:597 start_codon:yes stop_codon:yes gene_type:complete
VIEFKNLNQETPYLLFKEKYDEAFNAGQKNIEAISIASFNKEKNEVDSRFVNLKIIDHDNFIFFSNYNSPKSLAFESHNQVSVNIYWPVINLQIRMKAKISKKERSYNQAYFLKRSAEKNALAISSDQSKSISSYDLVVKNYNEVKKDMDLKECPEYWGGFTFKPYEIEFWEGNSFRLNKRNMYKLVDDTWHHNILQP